MTKGIQSWATGYCLEPSIFVVNSHHITNSFRNYLYTNNEQTFEEVKKWVRCQGVNNNCWNPCSVIAWGPQWWLYCYSSDLWPVISWNLTLNLVRVPGMPELMKRRWWRRDNFWCRNSSKDKTENILNGLKDLQTWWVHKFFCQRYDLLTNLDKPFYVCDDTCRDLEGKTGSWDDYNYFVTVWTISFTAPRNQKPVTTEINVSHYYIIKLWLIWWQIDSQQHLKSCEMLSHSKKV